CTPNGFTQCPPEETICPMVETECGSAGYVTSCGGANFNPTQCPVHFTSCPADLSYCNTGVKSASKDPSDGDAALPVKPAGKVPSFGTQAPK
ncbi:MAG: hypothetical protein JXR77_17040, partial [Lentisphaeria bacterium]|nr:hypothetical protein [Lentisphaeria bacterium]